MLNTLRRKTGLAERGKDALRFVSRIFPPILALALTLPHSIDFCRYSFTLGSEWEGRPYHSLGEPMDSVRELVARNVVPGARVYLVNNPKRHPSVQTALHQALAWQRMPDPVGFGDLHSAGHADAFLIPRADEASPCLEADDTSAFLCMGEAEEWSLRVKEEIALSEPLPPVDRIPAWREFLGFLPLAIVAAFGAWAVGAAGVAGAVSLFSVLLFAWLFLPFPFTRMTVLAVSALTCGIIRFLKTRCEKTKQQVCNRGTGLAVPSPVNKISLGMGTALFILLSAISLTHTFLPPNGLAVIGGKAKLLTLYNGFPTGFFTLPDWKSLEPAYPPGLASLVAGCFAVSGCCGEWCTQLVGCMAMSFLLFALVKHAGNIVGALWFAALFLPQLCLEIGSSLYPDPFLALLVVTGWQRVTERESDWTGWLLIGMSGWFKNEGVVYLLAAWLSLRATRGTKAAPLPHLLAALTIPLFWQFGCRAMGATLNGYAALCNPDFGKMWSACMGMARYCFFKPWEYAFVYPLLAVSLIGSCFCNPVRLAVSKIYPVCLFTAFSLAAFAWLYSCSLAPDFRWHVETALPRLLWIPALLVAHDFFTLRKSSIKYI